MTRNAWAATLLFLACAGCLPLRSDSTRVIDTRVSKMLPAPAPPPVNPKQVTTENARKMSTALWDEMDRAEQSDFLPENSSPTPKKKK